MLADQRIELTNDPAIPWVRRGETVDSLSPGVASMHPFSVWLVLDNGTDHEDGTRIVSVHTTHMGALKAKGRELRMHLSTMEPIHCTERYDWKTYTARPCEWWYSELPDICVKPFTVVP